MGFLAADALVKGAVGMIAPAIHENRVDTARSPVAIDVSGVFDDASAEVLVGIKRASNIYAGQAGLRKRVHDWERIWAVEMEILRGKGCLNSGLPRVVIGRDGPFFGGGGNLID